MEKGTLIITAISTGLLMSVLSYRFLNLIYKKHLRETMNITTSNYKDNYKYITFIIGFGSLALLTIKSLEIAAIYMIIPLFLWIINILKLLKYRNKRRALIAKEFPLLLDFLVLQVESGHSIQQAIRAASGLFSIGSHLHKGLCNLEESMQIGESIIQALEKLAQWLDTTAVDIPIMSISQAIQHGTPLGKTLREQSKRMREDLILEGEQFANTVSVKILIPLLVFIFPASFLVIFSPVIVSLSSRLN